MDYHPQTRVPEVTEMHEDRKPKASLEGACATLMKLLGNMNLPDVPGIDELSTKDRSFLMVTCCSVVIEHTICMGTGYDAERARFGLDSLVEDMHAHIPHLCAERKYAAHHS